jgi:hypothetical protein
MKTTTTCDFCGGDMDLGQEFVYQFESLNFAEHPNLLEIIRRLPYDAGEPF